MLIVFRAGGRPDVAAIRRTIKAAEGVTIGNDPDETSSSGNAEPLWLELLIGGMAFDLAGMAPGPAFSAADLRNRYDVPADFAETLGEALSLSPGPHIAGGRATVPVVRMQAALAAHLVRSLPDAVAVAWEPARALLGREFFLSIADGWRAGGPFPALGLTAFRQMLGGAIQSEGLAFFTGQELHFDNALFPDPAAAIQLGARLVDELVGYPPLVEPGSLAGPDGSCIALKPSGNGRFLRVERG